MASTQDEANWNKVVEERQRQHAEPNILRALIDRFIDWGVLTLQDGNVLGYKVDWPDLFALSDTEKAELAKNITSAVKDYVSSIGLIDVQTVLSVDELRERLGFEARTPEEIRDALLEAEDEELDETETQIIEQFKLLKGRA